MSCLLQCFKEEILIHLMIVNKNHEENNINLFVVYNRLDLVKFVYQETDAFIDNISIVDQAADNRTLDML